jgi:predicted transcriptional regulator
MSNAPPTPDKQPAKEDRVVSVRLSDSLIAGADKIAAATERNRMQVIRLALKTFIDAQA